MPDKDIIIEKTNNIQRCLKRIKDVTRLDPASLDSLDIQDIFVLNLQRTVQAVIDIAVHIVSDQGWGVEKILKENFSVLEKNKVINAILAEKLKKMVDFRNMAVHDYSRLDIEILKNILQNSLNDIEIFYTTIIKKYQI